MPRQASRLGSGPHRNRGEAGIRLDRQSHFLARAIEFTMAVADGFRIPQPTREADHFVNEIRRKRMAQAATGGGAGEPG